MRLFDIFNRHPRGEISAHADGELAPDRLDTLEAHLAGCERCRLELDELLAVRSALRDLPQVAAPRSFTLTPAMAERERTPVTSRTTPSFVAMRVAGAGFAAVLAVVVMLDAGGIVDDTGRVSNDESSTALFEADQTNRDAATADLYDSLAEDDAAAPSAGGDGDVGGVGAAPNSGGVDGGPDGFGDAPDSGDEDPAAAPLPTNAGQEPNGDEDPPLNQLPDDGERQEPADITITSGDANNLNDSTGGDDKALAPESGDAAPVTLTSDDGGVSSLLIIEIGLAAIAALAIGGSFVIRRPAESE